MRAPTDLDRYRFVARLGSGGMSAVTLAEDTVLGRRVALKRLSAGDDDRGLRRLRREALIGASVSHPNLVSIYDILTGEDGDEVIVMEYVEGETLREALERRGRLPPADALRVLADVGAALDAMHRNGIVHRDVKPGNVLLGKDGAVKLADLGIASVADRTRITTAGTVLGTFSYMAPEQLEGSEPTPAVDVYALAAVAFEALSGVKARSESNPVALAHAIATQRPPDLRDAWPGAPAGAAEVLMRGMSRDPAERPRSASELVGRLRGALEPPGRPPPPAFVPGAATPPPGRPNSSPRPPSVPGASRSGQIAAGLLALLLAAVAIAVILGSGGGGTHPRAAAKHGPFRAQRRNPPPRPIPSSTAATSTPAAASTSTTASSTAGSTAGTAPAGHGAPATSGAAGPVSAVESFYSLAAAHRYAQAWTLADPAFRAQLGGYPSFRSGQEGDRSITFDAARTISQSADAATVAVRTTSVRTTGTQHCSGTVELRRAGGSGGWLLHQIQINCE